MRLKLILTTLAVLLLSTEASARGVVFATSEDISTFDRMVSQSKEKSRSRADQNQIRRGQEAQQNKDVRNQNQSRSLKNSKVQKGDRRPDRSESSARSSRKDRSPGRGQRGR